MPAVADANGAAVLKLYRPRSRTEELIVHGSLLMGSLNQSKTLYVTQSQDAGPTQPRWLLVEALLGDARACHGPTGAALGIASQASNPVVGFKPMVGAVLNSGLPFRSPKKPRQDRLNCYGLVGFPPSA